MVTYVNRMMLLSISWSLSWMVWFVGSVGGPILALGYASRVMFAHWWLPGNPVVYDKRCSVGIRCFSNRLKLVLICVKSAPIRSLGTFSR